MKMAALVTVRVATKKTGVQAVVATPVVAKMTEDMKLLTKAVVLGVTMRVVRWIAHGTIYVTHRSMALYTKSISIWPGCNSVIQSMNSIESSFPTVGMMAL